MNKIIAAGTVGLALMGCQQSGPAGPKGDSCTVAQGTDSATISCEDGTSAEVMDGLDGAQGPPGPTSSGGILGREVVLDGGTCVAVTSVTPMGVLVADGNTCVDRVGCPAGKVVIGGGHTLTISPTSRISNNTKAVPTAWIDSSIPTDENGVIGVVNYTHWQVRVVNFSFGDVSYGIFAICANEGP